MHNEEKLLEFCKGHVDTIVHVAVAAAGKDTEAVRAEIEALKASLYESLLPVFRGTISPTAVDAWLASRAVPNLDVYVREWQAAQPLIGIVLDGLNAQKKAKK